MKTKSYLILLLVSLMSGLDTKLSKTKISKEFAAKLAQVQSLDHFKEMFHITELLYDAPEVSKRTSNGSLHQISKRVATPPPPCAPIPMPVPLREDVSDEIIVPSCIIMHRCAGCGYDCYGKKICRPTETKELKENVYQMSAEGGFLGMLEISYTNHTECDCMCIQDPSVCTANEKFNEHICECECGGEQQCPQHKQWSESHCACVCSESCHVTGQIQNPDTCLCSAPEDIHDREKILEETKDTEKKLEEEETFVEQVFPDEGEEFYFN